MNEVEHRALKDLKAGLDWAATAAHAWRAAPFHVDGLHPKAEELILDGIAEAARSQDASPLGVAIRGEGGVGKTHLLGWVRRSTEERAGYFFLIDFSFGAGGDFWSLTARAMVEDLGRAATDGGATQAAVLMRRLARLANVDESVSGAVAGDRPCARDDLDALIKGLLGLDKARILRCADTIRAIALYCSPDLAAIETGHDHLTSTEEAEEGTRQAWGLSRRVPGHQDVVVQLSLILALTGPTVIAVDQIDALLEQSGKTAEGEAEQQVGLLEEVAAGLMALRHVTQRTLCVVACLPSSWRLLEQRVIATVQDRFRSSLVLGTIPDDRIARRLVERRFAAALQGTGFIPPWLGWPVSNEAYGSAADLTPRALMQRIDAHLQTCLRDGRVQALTSFDEEAEPVHQGGGIEPAPAKALDALDRRFAELRGAASVDGAFDPQTEDETVPGLLAAGLTAWIREAGPEGRAFSVDPLPGRRPELHARLRHILDQDTERQRHWTFRMIGAPDARAALKRLRDARAAAGRGPATTDRTLVVLRNVRWSDGVATREQLELLADSGGRSLAVTADDLRTFAALDTLLDERHPDLDDWLTSRRPASSTDLLRIVLPDVRPTRPTSATPSPSPGAPPPDALDGVVVPFPTPPVRPPAPSTGLPPAPPPNPAPWRPTPVDSASPGPRLTGSPSGTETTPPYGAPLVVPFPPPGQASTPPSTPPIPLRPDRDPASGPEPRLADTPAPTAPFTFPTPIPRPEATPSEASRTEPAPVRADKATSVPTPFAPPAPHEPIRIGTRAGGDQAVTLDPALLTRHTAVFAGAGSGKTVLIRRLIEECALRGVSSIVLDPNNDLARLGDPWPSPPEGWAPGDVERARAYHEATEVVVWTPGRSGGRPLSFQPLPDFAAVRDDPDEFSSALDMAVAELAPRAKTEGTTGKAAVGKAVLREALTYFARRRDGGDLTSLLALLSDLPVEASTINGADEIAARLAQTLAADMINDPLFGGAGEPVDPRLLLTPSTGRRARISVISFVGLAEDRRPDFVRGLQMALFSWIKRNPARDRPLGALLVMDEAQTVAPASPRTPSLASTVTLASQARKYGLGLVFATQAPRALHNQVSGNATTQFFGRLNAPAQLAAAKELARARGGTGSRIGRLERGQFYVTSEGVPESLALIPLCLSHHPPSPLNEGEILSRARRG
ncbi:DUF87 domain-containing protein [Actinocorallia sp. API 0066]|uniref:ATP-binding protein n=1 Tax=Actinocorallia sp. API 0066 TaxID=2896846 RepID=UPI001E384022|nr:ATP-binding protein [Actinocorallia sp. API 0066]MCD0452887.1 DUF87 domain-containing protein [Actinocorallia sp. API 0066]